jgi:hypothetical protein
MNANADSICDRLENAGSNPVLAIMDDEDLMRRELQAENNLLSALRERVRYHELVVADLKKRLGDDGW